MSQSITLINAFTVPAEESDLFLQRWKETAAFMAGQPGFIRATMYRARTDDVELRFINVADWESEQAFNDATASPQFRASTQRMLADPQLHVVPRPAVYDVAVNLRPGDEL